MATVVEGDFEWDDEKATANFVKHVVHIARGTRDRIISVRRAAPAERAVYESEGQ